MVNELRAPVWEAITAEVGRGKAKDSFTKRAKTVGKRMQDAFAEFRAGTLSRVGAIKKYQNALHDLRRDYEARTIH